MNFELSEDQRTFQTLAKNFSDNELKPNAAKWDTECIFPVGNNQKSWWIRILFLVCFRRKWGGWASIKLMQLSSLKSYPLVAQAQLRL